MNELYRLKIRMPDTLPDYEVKLKNKTRSLALVEARGIFGDLEMCMPDHEFSVYDATLVTESLDVDFFLQHEEGNTITLPPIPRGFFPLGDNAA